MRANIKSPIIITLCICVMPVTAWGSSENKSPPYGLWSWCKKADETPFPVTVVRNEDSRSIAVGTDKIHSLPDKEKTRFSFPNGEYFEITRLRGTQLEGTWFQPPLNHYGYFAKMATKVTLANVAKGQWQGDIYLQPRTFQLFLDIYPDHEGKPRAVIRNPERNDVFGATVFDVVHAGDKADGSDWQLIARRGGRVVVVPFNHGADNSITLEHYQLPEPAVLSRNNQCDLNNYYSRPPSVKPYKRNPVKQLRDGWDVADAADAGFDASVLDSLVQRLSTSDPRDRSPQLLHSLLVSYKGQLVLEEYFFGHTISTAHDTRSLAKVFGSVLIGAAQQQNLELTDAYAPLTEVFSQHELAVPDNKKHITLAHFLTYTSGQDMAENDTSKGSEDRLWQQQESNFWLYTAQLPVLHKPGTRYAYASASANMVGAAIQQVTDQSVHEFFHLAIALPMTFSPYHWNMTPDDTPYLGGGVYMRPRDILKLAALYASNGRWNGQQIISEQWVEVSTSPKIDISPETTGMSDQEFANNYFGGKQAYIWRVDTVVVGEKVYSSYEATGNGGQVIVVIPELELAVGFTGGNYRMGGVWGKWRQKIIGEYLIPALRAK